ncbi:MAG TPA: class I SAM-dependent methyltransferase [Mycobacteriales bacterium]|jgi:ubiquinone/menaquinone biosynthesis C-methylase UbiE|nr:class I SAM-dependent methyltransferase [Mycobacteriales bacterium]
MTDLLDHVRAYWDADADTYDRSHRVGSPTERAAWTAAFARLLPPPPARVLDVGAGTGFLALQLAALGYAVTALDLSPGMLVKLRDDAERRGLDVTLAEGPADRPPDGPFDVVTERHLLWVLPDAVAALGAWRRVAPEGRLVAFEGLWGDADPAQQRRQHGREALRRLRRRPAAHHAELSQGLPFEHGMHPDRVCDAVQQAGWPAPRLERLPDVEWARLLTMPPAERLLGTTPQYAVAAG